MYVPWTQEVLSTKWFVFSTYLKDFEPVLRPRSFVSFILLNIHSAISWLSAPFFLSLLFFTAPFTLSSLMQHSLSTTLYFWGIVCTLFFFFSGLYSRQKCFRFHLFHKEAQIFPSYLLIKVAFLPTITTNLVILERQLDALSHIRIP